MRLRLVVSVLFLNIKLQFCWCFCRESSSEKTYIIENHLSYHNKQFTYNGSIADCNCDRKLCMRKCCEENYVFVDEMCVPSNSSILYNVYEKEDLIEHTSLQQYIIPGIPKCPNKYYRLDPDELPEDAFYLQKDGRLWVPDETHYINNDEYCIESTEGKIWALACIIPVVVPEQVINTAGMLISTPFLLATFILYALQPEKNIHGKSLMCYVLSLLAAYIFLSIVNSVHMPKFICVPTALVGLYFFTASFLWMNSMSIDICWTFSGSRDFSGNTKATARKHFLLYNLYAWGLPIVLVLLVGLFNTFGSSNSWYNPNIGSGTCWIKGTHITLQKVLHVTVSGNIPELIYFYLPLVLMIVVNLILFAITAIKIRKLQKDTAMLHSAQFKKHNEEEQKRFKLYINLSLAMGVNWIMEIVSFVVNWQVGSVPQSVWYLTDLCNALYGVIIFFIFAFKKKIWIAAKNRCTCCKSKEKPQGSPYHTTESVM